MKNLDVVVNKTKPFLRWAGGKRWFIKRIDELLEAKTFNNYHEPFLGGGAIFFHLSPKNSFLSDANKDLIETYLEVKRSPGKVIEELNKFPISEEDYYNIRSLSFENKFQRAARFIYLNQMSFNGIYRVNQKGEFNVPFGRRYNYKFDTDNIIRVSNLLQNAKIIHRDFGEVLNDVQEGDLVFLDPPYTITHNQNGFVQYNQRIFSLKDQYRLADTIAEIKSNGAYYILTNAAHSKVKEIFGRHDKPIAIDRMSLVGGRNAKRGMYSEFIFTNIEK